MKKLFPDCTFSWSMRMRRGSGTEFFRQKEVDLSILEEKKEWIRNRSDLVIASNQKGDELLHECFKKAEDWGHLSNSPETDPTFAALGQIWEADFILMDLASTELVGGCVCFPSSWDIRESIGIPLTEIHDRVPGLNQAIGDKISTFLNRMTEDQFFFRENWGLTATDDLNYHPDLNRRPIGSDCDAQNIFLRIEHQVFARIKSGIILGVRIEPISFADLMADYPETACELRGQLETMPPDVIAYKNLGGGIETAIEILQKCR